MQRIAAIVQRLGIIRLERQRLLVAGERLLVAFQHRQHHAVMAMRRRGPRVGGKRGADQLERGGRLAALMHQHAIKVQRVEMAGLGGDDFAIERFGLGQLAATMMRAGAAQQLGGVGGRGLRFGHRQIVLIQDGCIFFSEQVAHRHTHRDQNLARLGEQLLRTHARGAFPGTGRR